jgi:hypothetical protein
LFCPLRFSGAFADDRRAQAIFQKKTLQNLQGLSTATVSLVPGGVAYCGW